MEKAKLGHLLEQLPDEALYAISEEVYDALDWLHNQKFVPNDWKYEFGGWVNKWNNIRLIYAPNRDVLQDFFNIEIYEVGMTIDDCRGGLAPALYEAFASNSFNLSHKAFSLNTLEDELEFKSFPTFKDLLKNVFHPLKTTMWEVMENFLNSDSHPFNTVEEFENWVGTIVYHKTHSKKEKAERKEMGWCSFHDYYTRHYWLKWDTILEQQKIYVIEEF